ncbi:GIN domain-containing protein [Maricaulis parjimensis]|uniref:GIN domain-containing protein n=1 Tax=Maricaulis parjimensis TaxID=144023 RepID=UPI00193A2E7A|nr:DUF2807 domain-containing protein [Maricaulis parjimensis]
MSVKLITGGLVTLAGIGALAMTASAQPVAQNSFDGDSVSIENFIGRVEVRTGGSTLQVQVQNPGDAAEDPMMTASGNGVAIDGGQRVRNLNCRTRRDEVFIGRWTSSRSINEYPLLIITAPASVNFSIDDSAFVGEAGDLGSIDLSMNSCGKFSAGDIARDASIRINGSGDVDLRGIGGDAVLNVNGSGDIDAGNISGDAEIDINGSGDIDAGNVGGATAIDINGSGDIELGRLAALEIDISGSGDVEADAVNGAFSTSISGSGDVLVRGGRAEPFEARINGSGDIAFRGTAVNVTVRESGGGDVEIEEIEGAIDWRRNGRSILRVGSTD